MLALPAAFLVHRDGVAGTWVLRSGRAQWQPLTLGLRGAGVVEIRSGLTAGDRVVRASAPGTALDGRRVSSP